MKDVVIDNRKELVMVDGKVVPRILLRMMQGTAGKSFVVKRYRGGRMVVTHFPDMSGIVATGKQRMRRDLFREAVVWAKWVIADELRKLAFRNTLPRKKRRKVYQAALQMYIKEKGNKQWVSKQLAVMAVMSVKSERSKVNGGFEQMGQWRVMWQKKLNVNTFGAIGSKGIFLKEEGEVHMAPVVMHYMQGSRMKMESIGNSLDKLSW